jgi:CBS domain-containing protein
MELNAVSIMSSPVICAREDMTVAELTDLLDQKQISGVPVTDADGHLVGVISITDLIALSAETLDISPPEKSDFYTSPAMDGLAAVGGLLEPEEELRDIPISNLMSHQVITASEEDSIGKLADAMVSHRIHRLIVVRDEKISGIVSIRDILGGLQTHYRNQS